MTKIQHGTKSCYVHNGCRRPECSAANNRAVTELRHGHRPEDMPDDVEHGTDRAYRSWNCRCTECREGNATRKREQYAARQSQRGHA